MPKKFDPKDELYNALGRFITSFAEIEHWLTAILETLTDADDNIWLTLFFIDDLLTGKARDTIHKVARLRLEDNPPLHEKLKAILKQVGELTEKRNELIHGQWVFDSTITKLHNYRLTKVDVGKGRHVWQHLSDKAVFARDINELTRKSEQIAGGLGNLREEIADYLAAERRPTQ